MRTTIEQNPDVELSVSRMAVSACIDLFEAYRVPLTSAGAVWGESGRPLLSGVIGFVGSRVRGTCLLASAEPLIAASCPPGGRLRDWTGELTNQLMGRLKSKLVSRELSVELSTPIVLSGVKIQPLPKARLEPTVLSAAGGEVLVWLEIETAPGFVLAAERDGLSGNEGDVLIFE